MHLLAGDIFTAGNTAIAAIIGLLVGLATIAAFQLVIGAVRSSEGSPWPIVWAAALGAFVMFFVKFPDVFTGIVSGTLHFVGLA